MNDYKVSFSSFADQLEFLLSLHIALVFLVSSLSPEISRLTLCHLFLFYQCQICTEKISVTSKLTQFDFIVEKKYAFNFTALADFILVWGEQAAISFLR